jgi:hypothetical protein
MTLRTRLEKLETPQLDMRGCSACNGSTIVTIGEGENLPADLPECGNPERCGRIVIEEVIVSSRADALV